MNSSEIFKAAHKMTKSALQAGDSYAVTFAAALIEVYKVLKFKLENVMSIVMMGGSEKQNATNKQVIEIIENLALEYGIDDESLYVGYRGRGMYGSSCYGIVTDDPERLIEAAVEEGIKGASIDSLGLNTIVYWRCIKVE